MNNKKQYSPAAIVGMTTLTVAGVAFAVWNVNNALNPPAPPPDTTTPAAPTAPPSGAGTAAAPVAPAASASAAPNPAGTPGAGSRMASSEALLAPQADPFAPNGAVPPSAMQNQPLQQTQAPVVQRPLPPIPSNIQLQPFNPPLRSAFDIPPRAEKAAEPITPPELIGTLTGQHPSAVFRSKDGVVVVATGKSIGPWKLTRVVHGGAVLVSGSRKITLGTSMAGAVHAQREESATVVPVPQVAAIPIEEKPAPAETAPSPFLVAEAVPVSAPVPVGEPAAGPPTPDPAPAPGGDQPAPTPPVIQETAPPPKPSGVTEEPKKPNDTK